MRGHKALAKTREEAMIVDKENSMFLLRQENFNTHVS